MDQISLNDALTFFAVLVRVSTVTAVSPFFGDQVVPSQIKILLSLAISFTIYPVLVSNGAVIPAQAAIWGETAGGIVFTVFQEALFGLALGFSARFVFHTIQLGGNIMGTLMGMSAASQYDPMQESQSQVVAQILTAVSMLLFLAMDGHHVLLRATGESYRIVALGKAQIGATLSQGLISMSGDVIRFGVQFAGPMAVSLMAVNIVYGIMSKAMPQLNVLVLSFSVSAGIGLFVMFASFPEFHDLSVHLFQRMGDRVYDVMNAMKGT